MCSPKESGSTMTAGIEQRRRCPAVASGAPRGGLLWSRPDDEDSRDGCDTALRSSMWLRIAPAIHGRDGTGQVDGGGSRVVLLWRRRF